MAQNIEENNRKRVSGLLDELYNIREKEEKLEKGETGKYIIP